MREPELGLGDPPERRYLYVSQDDTDSSSCWYEYNFNTNTKTPVPQRALTGYITGLRCHSVTSKRHGTKTKLDIFVDAGQPFAIRSGLETVFTRGIILSLIAIPDAETMRQALTICATPSKEHGKVVFGSVYLATTGTRVKFEWDKQVDLAHLIEALQTIYTTGDLESESDNEDHGNAEADHHDWMDARPAPATRPAPSSGHTNGKPISADQMKEIKRLAVVKGMSLESGEVNMILLNQECGLHYGGRSVDYLTFSEAIEFRALLNSM